MNFIGNNKKFILFIFIAVAGTLFLMQEKTYANDFYKKYTKKTNIEMQKFELSEDLKAVAYSYLQDKKLPKTYRNTMYDCLGFSIYNNDPSALLQETLNECELDYTKKNGQAIYYNQAWLMRDVSKWDGSYILLERIIKKHIKEKASYKMKKVSFTMNFEDKRPHMFVSIDYKAANLGGRMYDKTMSVRVDAKTKELYDLK